MARIQGKYGEYETEFATFGSCIKVYKHVTVYWMFFEFTFPKKVYEFPYEDILGAHTLEEWGRLAVSEYEYETK